MKRAILIALFAGLSLMMPGCGSSGENAGGTSGGSQTAPDPGSPDLKAAPEFELENIAGGTFKSEDLKGKVAIVDFWATWCVPCIEEVPNYNELSAKYADKDVVLLGITMESGSLEDVKPKITEYNIKYPVVMGNDEVLTGFGGAIGFPTTFVVTQEGKIYQKYLGLRPKKRELLEKDIETLLQNADKLTKAGD